MAVTGSKEPWLSWRRMCLATMSILVIVLILRAAGPRVPYNPMTASHNSPSSGVSSISNIRFYDRFGQGELNNEAIDGLTTEECYAHFPEIFTEIKRSIAFWRARGHHITIDDSRLEPNRTGIIRLLIHENQLRALETHSALEEATRLIGNLHLINRALVSASAAGEILPTVEFALSVYDNADPPEEGTSTYWSVSRALSRGSQERLWLMPNYDFFYSPPSGSFEDAKRLAMQYDNASFIEKIPKVVWRGYPGLNPVQRGGLIDITKGKSWADVIGIPSDNPGDRLEEFQYCRYAMTVYTEGVAYSGRLKFLMNCASLLIIPEIEWAVHYTPVLVKDGPLQNYVSVKRDWSDLEEKVEYYLDHPEEADRIIKNALSAFRSRYTTRAATSCYIRELIKGYASVAEPPHVYYAMHDGEVQVPRGMPYAQYMLWPHDGSFEFSDHVGE